jgi:hypothetical protein
MTARGAWLAAILALAGCASPSPSVLPSRPQVPEGWVRYTSDARDVAVTVPPQLQVQDGRGEILAGYYRPAPDLLSFGVLAMGPTTELPEMEPPYTEDELVEWLLAIVSSRRPETFAHSWVVLPEGRAVEVRFTFDAGTPDEVAVVAEAIPTPDGVAFLTANCQADSMTECDEFLRLVPLLFDLNRPVGD